MTRRLPDLDPLEMTPEQREAFDTIASGPRGEVVGPLRIWLESPAFAVRAQALGAYCRYDSSLPPDLSELAILVTARLWSSGFEWTHHAPIALNAGIPQDVIDTIGQGRRPQLDGKAAAVLDVAIELHRDRQISNRTFEAALSALGRRGLVDLVGICGYYGLISMTINAFDIPPGDGPLLPETALPASGMFID